MDYALRRAWTDRISIADLDNHMHKVGQAAANAALLQSMLSTNRHDKQTNRVIVGDWAAQFLDYIPIATIERCNITFTGINPNFLERAQAFL
jgi:hypothetical protein